MAQKGPIGVYYYRSRCYTKRKMRPIVTDVAWSVCLCVCLRVYLSQSCPSVGLTHGLGWVGSTTAKVLKFERIILMHLKHG